MFKAYCYCCKQLIETTDEKEFRKSGHVSDRVEAYSKYGISTNRVLRFR